MENKLVNGVSELQLIDCTHSRCNIRAKGYKTNDPSSTKKFNKEKS